jgi:hypothetical protein
VKPGERASLDQSIEQLAGMLATFGVDRRDPVAMKGALAAVQSLAAVLAHTPPDFDCESIVRGLLLNLTEMQP